MKEVKSIVSDVNSLIGDLENTIIDLRRAIDQANYGKAEQLKITLKYASENMKLSSEFVNTIAERNI